MRKSHSQMHKTRTGTNQNIAFFVFVACLYFFRFLPIKMEGDQVPIIRIYATVPSGFEFSALAEANERFGEDISSTHTERGALRFSIPLSRIEDVVKLRAVDHLYVVMLETTKSFSEDKEEALKSTRDFVTVTDDASWKNGFAVWKKITHTLSPVKCSVDIPSNFYPDGDYVPSFRATCYRSGKHSFSSQEAMAEFGGALNSHFNWKVDLKNYDVEVVLVIDDDRVSVCLALTKEPLFRRNITFFGPTTLRATICYSMVRMSDPQDGEVLCDPMCGSGAIPIEAALGFPKLQVVCGDNFLAAAVKTAENVRAIETRSGIPFRNLDAIQWDLGSFPLKPNSVDIWVSDFPFGKRHKCNRFILYPKALSAMALSSKPGVSRAIILTQDRQAMAAALRATKFWYMRRMIGVNIGGLNACVYSLLRTTFV